MKTILRASAICLVCAGSALGRRHLVERHFRHAFAGQCQRGAGAYETDGGRAQDRFHNVLPDFRPVGRRAACGNCCIPSR